MQRAEEHNNNTESMVMFVSSVSGARERDAYAIEIVPNVSAKLYTHTFVVFVGKKTHHHTHALSLARESA